MSYWLVEPKPLSLVLQTTGSADDENDDDSETADDEDLLSRTPSECSKEYDEDDDFDNRSLEIDEEERNKISAQINPDDTEEEDDSKEEKVKEEISEKEDSVQEKDLHKSEYNVVVVNCASM